MREACRSAKGEKVRVRTRETEGERTMTALKSDVTQPPHCLQCHCSPGNTSSAPIIFLSILDTSLSSWDHSFVLGFVLVCTKKHNLTNFSQPHYFWNQNSIKSTNTERYSHLLSSVEGPWRIKITLYNHIRSFPSPALFWEVICT